MVVVKKGDTDTRLPLEIRGKSTDEKPVGTAEGLPIEHGSAFLEIDTGDVFFYDKDTQTWLAT